MNILWVIILLSYNIRVIYTGNEWATFEYYHYPGFFTPLLSTYVNGTETEIAPRYKTPDYRVEEKMYTPYTTFFKERERPYRLSPNYKQTYNWPKVEKAYNLGCYCCTSYRRHIPLAGCAVLTTRHILTTATPTELILRSYGHLKTLSGILGAWYDVDTNLYNSSLYLTPARIHFHPLYKYDYEMNASHPIPCLYDLSVWAATFRFYGRAWTLSGAVICFRGVSGWFEYSSSIPRGGDLGVVVGFQFMKALKRRPSPWLKFGVRTKNYIWPCPKSDWHWYHCVQGEYWGKYGMDSGGALHIMIEGKSNRIDGFVGMCAFSLKLRSKQTTHYFTVVDTHVVLDFMYDAYLGLKPYKYLDHRFEDTKWAAPLPWWGLYIDETYVWGWDIYQYPLPYW